MCEAFRCGGTETHLKCARSQKGFLRPGFGTAGVKWGSPKYEDGRRVLASRGEALWHEVSRSEPDAARPKRGLALTNAAVERHQLLDTRLNWLRRKEEDPVGLATAICKPARSRA